MNEKKLKSYLGKDVLITFIDGRKRSGILGFTTKMCKEQGYKLADMFNVGNASFKPCFVKQVLSKEELRNV